MFEYVPDNSVCLCTDEPVSQAFKAYENKDVEKVKANQFVLEFVLSEETDVPSESEYEEAYTTTVNFLRVFFSMIYDDAFISVEAKKTREKFDNGRPQIGIAPTLAFLDGMVKVQSQDAAALVEQAFTDTSALQYFIEHLHGLPEPNVFRDTVDVVYLTNKNEKDTNVTVAPVPGSNRGLAAAFAGVALLLSVAMGTKARKCKNMNLIRRDNETAQQVEVEIVHTSTKVPSFYLKNGKGEFS